MRIYAISDTHFGHDKLVELSGRPVGFDDMIMDNLSKVSGDLLIHCGDFCIGNDAVHMADFVEATAGFKKKILVRGNHDGKSDSWYLERGFDVVCESMTNTYFGKQILFTHIPTAVTERFDFNVHGHMHGNQHRKAPENGYDPTWHRDLAPEINNYKPVLLERFLSPHLPTE